MTDASDLSRRGLFAAGAVAGAAAITGFGPAAMAQGAAEAGPLRPRMFQFTVGDFTVTTLSDGLRQGDGPHPIFGQDQDAATVHALLEKNFLPPAQFVNGFTPTLIDTGSQKILFDTGLGAMGRGGGMGKLTQRLAAVGVPAEAIDIVVITHMHGDHIGGLMEDGSPAFPNARYVTGQAEYDHWTSTDNGLVQSNVVPLAEKTTFLKPGGSVVSGIEAVEAFGHTPGHMAFHVESGGKRLMLTADTANHYVVSLQRPDWHVQYDMDKEAAAATRKKIFGMLAADKVPFIGYHMPFPSLGYVSAEGQGFRWMPATYQVEL